MAWCPATCGRAPPERGPPALTAGRAYGTVVGCARAVGPPLVRLLVHVTKVRHARARGSDHDRTLSRPTRRRDSAYDSAAGPQGPPAEGVEDEDARPQGEPPASRRLHACLHDHPEEAELGPAEGRPRP